jgi:pseudaminic acid biosynthesis-associated methylase
MTVHPQLDVWRGEFGEAYTRRNEIDWRKRLPAFHEAVGELRLRRVLEVGCNRGHNLVALGEVAGPSCQVVGVEPNYFARALARRSAERASLVGGGIHDLPFCSGTFDLVLTLGVLIHVPLDDLRAAMSELHRVSGSYLLCAEYYAEVETPISYRGRDDLLWKRDFAAHYRRWFTDLSVVRQGFWSADQGFDRATWLLLEKG